MKLGPATSRSKRQRKTEKKLGKERKIERKRASPRLASKLLTSRATGQPFGLETLDQQAYIPRLTIPSTEKVEQEHGQKIEKERRARTKKVSLLRTGW
ncbi:unnamed protein product, partial [Heterotrigona itama]